IFYLKTKGKARGYVERVEATGSGGGPIKIDIETGRNARQRNLELVIKPPHFSSPVAGLRLSPGLAHAHPMDRNVARAPVSRPGHAVARLAHPAPPNGRKEVMLGRLFPLSGLALVLSALVLPAPARAGPEEWRREWPHTDFSRHSVAYEEILSGGPPKDGIPAIDHPSFVAVADARGLAPPEPMISVAIGGEARAYPLRVMIWHEIVNDTLGATP